MPQLEARRSERIDYSAEVELIARSGVSAMPHSMLAQALDLGPGGMRISTRSQMPIGAEVTCRMTLDGRPAALPGRVVWCSEQSQQELSSMHGMGICFESLGAYESGLLQHVVERSGAGYRPVELHFAGIDQPVIARARAHGDGLRLSAALPIFSRGTELSFQFDEEGPHFTGSIGNATLREENGARRLEIDIDVVGDGFDVDNVRFRRRARYGYAEEIEAEEQHEVEAARPLSHTQPTQRIAAERRVRGQGFALLPMFIAALVGGTLAWSAASRFSETKVASQAEFVARPLPMPAPEPSSGDPQPAITAESVSSTAALAATASAQESAQAQPSRAPTLPVSVVDANATRIRVPFEGTLDGMRSTIWAAPAALAIDLPRGATTLEPGRYPIDEGGVTDLRVNRNARSLLLRIRLAAPVGRYAIALENGVLEAQLLRPRVSHAAH